MLDQDGRVCKVNARFASMLGYTVEEIYNLKVWDWDGQFSRNEILNLIHQIDGIGHRFETRHLRRDGTFLDVELCNSAALFRGRKMIFCLCRDISERKKAVAALKRSEAKFRSLFQKHSAVKLLIDPDDGRILDANKAATVFYGWSNNELKAMHVQDINIMPFEQIMQEMEKVRSNEQVCFEFQHLRADGSIRDVMVYCSAIELENRTVLHSIVQDITKQRQLEEQLRQAQKMESIGLLAGGIAHDFNNITGVVLGYAEMALGKLEESSPLYDSLTEILNAARRSTELTKQLLAFAKQQPGQPRALSLNESVEKMSKMTQRLLGEDIRFCWYPSVDHWFLWMDPSQLDQIILNLCVNARDSISGVGTVLIETKNVTLDEDACAALSNLSPGDYIVLTVRDDGCGMDEETRGRLFEPFYTTKKFGQGTGLGLAIVYGIVKQNNGFILVESAPGKGTTFKIYFPRHSRMNVATREEKRASLCSLQRETILVVEDDPFVRKLIRQMLNELGHVVLESDGPVDALVQADQHMGKIHILLTDVVMPEMNGRDLAERIEIMCPNISTVFMSGYTAGIISQKGVMEDGFTFLQKPFSTAELSDALQCATVRRANRNSLQVRKQID